MNFDTFLNQAWSDHAAKPNEVAQQFASVLTLVSSEQELSDSLQLITHVMGTHLKEWNDGILILKNLKFHLHFKAGSELESTIDRNIAVFQVAQKMISPLEEFHYVDQVKILTSAAAAIADSDASFAHELFNKAIAMNQSLEKLNPTNRSLAIAGNGIASGLEDKSNRTPQEIELMVLGALTARKYWELAGTWLEVSRAEYRLAKTYLQALEQTKSLWHAQTCLKICLENKAGTLDMFYAYEALALTEKSINNEAEFKKALGLARLSFDQLNESDKSWCKADLDKISL